MTKQLPARPNLEHLKNQAKALFSSWKSNEPKALSRVAPFRFVEASEPSLAKAQLVVAREYGFGSWAKLKTHVESFVGSIEEAAKKLCEWGTIDSMSSKKEDSIRRLLEAFPGLENHDLASACILGNFYFVEEAINRDPQAATSKTGPQNWEPILYCCFSWFLRYDEERKPDIRKCVRLLLDKGAEPNSAWDWEKHPLSALYGAAGVANDRETVQMLLDAGANVNDGESFYHGVEHLGTQVLELLFAKGADKAHQSHAVFRKLDFDDFETFAWLFDQGIDVNIRWEPSGETALIKSAASRDIRYVRFLLERGADQNLTNKVGLTAFAIAKRRGREEIAQLLLDHGAKKELRPFDEWLVAAQAGKAQSLAKPDFEKLETHDKNALVDLAGEGNLEGVRNLLGAGFPIELGQWSTPLHWTCWKGQLEVARFLIARGSPLDLKDPVYSATPFGWTCHGSVNCKESPPENYVEIAKALLEAGYSMSEKELEWRSEEGVASPEIQAWLLEMP